MKRRLANGHTLGGGEGNQFGYTITELIIVIAVTGAMFAGIAAAFSGRMSTAQFTDSVRAYESRLQDLANSVNSGLPSLNGYGCKWVKDSAPVFTAGGDSDGNCIFLGKVLVSSGQSGVVHDIVARRTLGSSKVLNDITFNDMRFYEDQAANAADNILDISNIGIDFFNKGGLYVYDIVDIGSLIPRDIASIFFIKRKDTTLSGNMAHSWRYNEDDNVIISLMEDVPDNDSLRTHNSFGASKGVAICVKGYGNKIAKIVMGGGGNVGQGRPGFGVSIVSELDIHPRPGEVCYEAP